MQVSGKNRGVSVSPLVAFLTNMRITQRVRTGACRFRSARARGPDTGTFSVSGTLTLGRALPQPARGRGGVHR